MIKEEFQDYAEYAPKINGWEVKEYENKFREKVHNDVKFNTEEGKEFSMSLYKGESGVEATWSGTILLPGENYIEWNFSLQNLPEINAKMTITDENCKIVSNLCDFYKVWKEDWSKMITTEPSQGKEPEGTVGAPFVNQKADEEAILKEEMLIVRRYSNRNRKDVIGVYSERMRKLAGLIK